MNTKVTTRLEAGDLIANGDNIFMVQTFDHERPCSEQCHLYDEKAERCNGYCYRWSNGEDFVFRKIISIGLAGDHVTVCRTPDVMGEAILAMQLKQRIEANNAYLERRKNDKKE